VIYTYFAFRMHDVQSHLTIDGEQWLVYHNFFRRKLA
jgi:hypothetical protein